MLLSQTTLPLSGLTWDICFLFIEFLSETFTLHLTNKPSPHNTFHIHAYRERKRRLRIQSGFFLLHGGRTLIIVFAFHWTEKFYASVQPSRVASLCAQKKRRNGYWQTSYLLVLCASIPLIFLFWEHSKLISTLGIFVLGLLCCKSIKHSISKEWLEQILYLRRMFIPMFLTKDGPSILANAISSEKASQPPSVTLSSFNFK